MSSEQPPLTLLQTAVDKFYNPNRKPFENYLQKIDEQQKPGSSQPTLDEIIKKQREFRKKKLELINWKLELEKEEEKKTGDLGGFTLQLQKERLNKLFNK